jgi:hypothetical protein
MVQIRNFSVHRVPLSGYNNYDIVSKRNYQSGQTGKKISNKCAKRIKHGDKALFNKAWRDEALFNKAWSQGVV